MFNVESKETGIEYTVYNISGERFLIYANGKFGYHHFSLFMPANSKDCYTEAPAKSLFKASSDREVI